MSPSETPRAPTREQLERRITELENLHEIARSLLGAGDASQVASRVVYAAMGTFGARSGAIFLADERGRMKLAFAYAEEDFPSGLPLNLEVSSREWLQKAGAFRLTGGGGRALLGARERLIEDFGAAAGVAIGLSGLLVLGARLMETEYDVDDLAILDSLAGLAVLALGTRGGPAATPELEPPMPARKASRPLEAIREQYPPLRSIVGESPALLEAFEDMIAVAVTRFPVLINGESGVGKELAARAIHELSDRADGPMEVVDCGSIPRELIESELFGHVKGSFTGAHRDRKGAFEMARRGTLFLDEIGEMPLQLQTRLLRVLQEGRFRRVGDEQAIDADVRVVAATNRDLTAEVSSGRFRQDLFYRLNVFSLRLPALRERAGDLPLLMQHFLPCERGREWDVAPGALDAIASHDWPGNIRELGNFCAALAVRAKQKGRITMDDLDFVWSRQYRGEPPWRGSAHAAAVSAPRGQLGDWVLEQARASGFNLIEAARRLAKQKRAGKSVPITERSALSYYVTGEILRALVEARGDEALASRALAGDPDLVPRVALRVGKVAEALRASASPAAAKRKFGKLPAGYEDVLDQAVTLG